MTVTGAVELLEAAKAEDTVSGGAHNVDGLSLTCLLYTSRCV